MTHVRVCPICDIADCAKHRPEKSDASMDDERRRALLDAISLPPDVQEGDRIVVILVRKDERIDPVTSPWRAFFRSLFGAS